MKLVWQSMTIVVITVMIMFMSFVGWYILTDPFTNTSDNEGVLAKVIAYEFCAFFAVLVGNISFYSYRKAHSQAVVPRANAKVGDAIRNILQSRP